MATYILLFIILLIGLIAIEIMKSYHALPIKELKYRASSGDELASRLYRAAAYGNSLEAFLWLVIVLCATGSLFLINSFAPFWLSFIAIALLLWLAFAWLPKTKPAKPANIIVRYCSPMVAWIMNYVHPLLRRISGRAVITTQHHIYDQQDLINLVNRLKNQEGSRINPEQLEIIKNCLNLSSVKITDLAKPWSKVKTVTDDEAVGPVLLDELVKSEQQFIPVKNKNETKKVIGILDMGKLNINAQAKVSNYMDKVVYYLNEDDSLDIALHAFGQTNYPAFIIVDDKNRLTGLLTFKDLVSQIISSEPGLSFNEYTDQEAVANKYQPKEETDQI